MNIYVKNTKLFNFYIGMAKRIVNKRDAMGNPLLGYVRLSAEMQNNTVEIESNDMYPESGSTFQPQTWTLKSLKTDPFFFRNPSATGSKAPRSL